MRFRNNTKIPIKFVLQNDIQNKIQQTSVTFSAKLQKDMWNKGTVQTIEGKREFELYIMLIPFDENGALETYLLNCVGNNDEYDKTIIDKGNVFVDAIDPEEKYLNQRRLKTKAKFDVYFSVRTAAEQYAERQNILKSVAWEEYNTIRTDFKVFDTLG